MNDDIMNTRHVNSASVEEYCRVNDMVLVPRNRYHELVEAYRKLKKKEEKETDYPFDPNVPEMGQL